MSMNINFTDAAISEFEEQCHHEFFELALLDNRVDTLCGLVATLVDLLGGIGQVPESYRPAALEAIAAVDVLAVRDIQWFPNANIGDQT